MAVTTSYEAMTGRSLPTGVTSVVEGQPDTYVTGGYSSYTTPSNDPAAGTDLGYETSPDGKQRRKKYADGKGGFTYGPWEPVDQGDDSDRRDAFALLKDTFAQYGLEELASTIEGYMKSNVGTNEATLLLKQTAVYKKRFAGNETRKAAGLNVLSESEYLALENSYSETLRSYGQAGYFGTDRNTRQAKLAEAIGADISPVEFKERISTVVERVNNADPAVKATLRSFYKITDEDLVGYFLSPKENLPRLKEKVTAAEIGSAASGQGLETGMAGAEELAKFGVDLATARQGYATIADVLPTTERLSSIYKEEGTNYTQQTAEQEVFKGLASAKRKRQALAEKEIGTFSGSSGTTKGSFSTGYLNRQSSAGTF